MSEKTKAFTRLVIVLVLAVNGLLAGIGVSPVSNENAYTVISDFVAILASVWTWWKNNNVTSEAAEAQGMLEALKDPETMEELTKGVEDLEWYEVGEIDE